MGKIYATTSGKGGVGKSSIAVGLGMAFASMGKKVLLVDMDEGLRCLDLLLGVEESAVFDLGDALRSGDVENSAFPCPTENLSLIPAPAFAGQIEDEPFKAFALKAAALFEIVIFDFPAGLDFRLYSLLPPKTVFLTVATADPVSIRSAAAVSLKLEELGLKARLIINRFDLKEHRKRKLKSIDGIIDFSSLRLLGIIPKTQEITCICSKHKLKKRSPVFKAFSRIASRLDGADIHLPKLKKI